MWYNVARHDSAPSEASVHREAYNMGEAHGLMSPDIILRRAKRVCIAKRITWAKHMG